MIKPLIVNKEKIAKDFGSVAAMARHYNVSYQTLRNILYKPASTYYGSTRDILTEKLLDEGYVSYPEYTPEELERAQRIIMNKWRRIRI